MATAIRAAMVVIYLVVSVMPGVVVVLVRLGLASTVVREQPHPLLVLRSSMALVVQV